MRIEDRAAAEQLLEQATEALRAADKSSNSGPDKTLARLFQLSLALRRELAGAEGVRDSCGPDALSSVPTELPRVAPTEIATEPELPKAEEKQGRGQRIWHRDLIHDFTLVRADRLLMSGLCLLAWLIEPSFSDSPLAVTGLAFVRFVPIFILVGSMYRHALSGAIVGAGLFFALLSAGALSAVMWDTHLLEPSVKLLAHTTGIAILLYVFAGLGLLLCVMAVFAARRSTGETPGQIWRLATQLCVLVQLALLVELGYSSWRYAARSEPRSASVATFRRIGREMVPRRIWRSARKDASASGGQLSMGRQTTLWQARERGLTDQIGP